MAAAVKFDFKKEYKDLYLPKSLPVLIDVPSMNFIMVDGCGDPKSAEYQEAMQILYSLSFTIKMSKMTGMTPKGYFDYVVPPLEGLWWSEQGNIDLNKRNEWLWTSMIRQPEFVNEEVYNWAVNECMNKKKNIPVERARFARFEEGLCVQIMHIGPYSDEGLSMDKVEDFILSNNLKNDSGIIRKHHEIYLSDPRKTSPGNLKTVIRTPVLVRSMKELNDTNAH